MDDRYIGQFTRSYINAILEIEEWPKGFDPDDWTGEPSDKFESSTLARIRIDCVRFVDENEEALDKINELWSRDASKCGYDFYLARNGHGTGFLNRSNTEFSSSIGDQLTSAAEAFHETNFHVENNLIVDNGCTSTTEEKIMQNTFGHDWHARFTPAIIKILTAVVTDAVTIETKHEALTVLTEGRLVFRDGKPLYDLESVGQYQLPAHIVKVIDQAIQAGKPLDAIKELRTATNVGLKEAKEAIEARKRHL